MNNEQKENEFLNYFGDTKNNEKERIEELKNLQKELHIISDTLGMDPDFRNETIRKAKEQLSKDVILFPYIYGDDSENKMAK